MDDNLVRARLSRLAASLRQFGLVDKFGLRDLLEGAGLPAIEHFAAKLKKYEESLPSGVPVDMLAAVLRRDVAAGEKDDKTNADLLADAETLRKLASGNDAAPEYHDLCIRVLGVLFDGSLRFEKKEAPLFGGRKRIDILYRNLFAAGGFFDRLSSVHKIPCPYVPVECKNYEEDPGNPDFDQLSGRLNDDVGKFGILVCRRVTDPKAALERCRSYKAKGEFHIYVADHDVLQMIKDRVEGHDSTVLGTKLRELLLA